MSIYTAKERTPAAVMQGDCEPASALVSAINAGWFTAGEALKAYNASVIYPVVSIYDAARAEQDYARYHDL